MRLNIRLDDWHLNVPADGTKGLFNHLRGLAWAKSSQHEAVANVFKEVQDRKITWNVIATAPACRWRSSYA